MDIYLLFILASRNKEQRTIWLLRGGRDFFARNLWWQNVFRWHTKPLCGWYFFARVSFCPKSVCRILFSETPIPPSLQKSNGWPPTDHFSSFWNSVFVFVRSSSMTFSNLHVANNVSNMLKAAFAFAWRAVVQFWPSLASLLGNHYCVVIFVLTRLMFHKCWALLIVTNSEKIP